MKHIYIIRHGETDNNKNHLLQGRKINASINEKGKQQAVGIANTLKDIPIQKVITSSLVRTLETAKPLIESKGLEFDQYEELDEMSFGDWEGKPFEEVIDQIRVIQKAWISGETDTKIPGGESPEEVFKRAGEKFLEILMSSEEKYIAFMLHGRLIRVLLSEFLGMGLKNMHQIQHQNGAINHLTWDGKSFSPVRLNNIDHLELEEFTYK